MILRKSFVAIVFLFCITMTAHGQQHHHFIVIGAFDLEQNAKRALLRAEDNNLPARYALHPERKRFYVYVRLVTDLSLARETVRNVRAEGFPSAWIYTGDLLYPQTLAKIEPLTTVPWDDDQAIAVVPTTPASDRPDSVVAEPPKPFSGEGLRLEVKSAPVKKAAENAFVFKVIGINGKDLKGTVRLQESDRANQFNPYNANEVVYVGAPKNRGGRWFLVCDVVGYRTMRIQFNYKDAAKIMETGPDGEFILPLELTPVKRGDYIELELVHFYTNSNIFTPDSRQSLDELAAMMIDNPGYRIRLHGHTNGDQDRDIVCALDDQNLFETDPANRKEVGSAKELSLQRALAGKRYLVEKGVEGKRIQVRGEGGKQMLYEGTLAALNDRLEVEVIKR